MIGIKLWHYKEDLKKLRKCTAANLPLLTGQAHCAGVPCSCRELEGEISCIREAVMVLGKVVERQGAGLLPSHGDPVWQLPGPLGGIQHALSVISKHTKVMLIPPLSLSGG
jgi:hypothetical protein